PAAGAAGGERGEASDPSPASDLASLAVLPFDNLTGDPGQEYFADGMTEEIITRLVRLERLKVISRTSVMRYRDADASLRQIGAELGVGTVLEGSVRREGRQVKVTAQLVDARTDAHLWAETYDRELESVFEIQADVAQAIARELELRFAAAPGSSAAAPGRYGTSDREALDLYLRARALWNLRTEDDLREAVALFEEAVDRDPEFAAAWAGMADAFVVLPAYVRPGPEVEAVDHGATYERATRAARRALELDPGLAEARAALGMAATYTHRWEAAGRHFRRALEGAPGYATAHQWYALHLSALGELDEAVLHAERARVLDPFAVAVTFDLAVVNFMARRYQAALRAVEQARQLSSGYVSALDFRVVVLEEMGRFGEAIEALDPYLREAFGEEVADEVMPEVRSAYEEDGPEGYYRARLDATEGLASDFVHALYLLRSGRTDRAFDALEEAAARSQFQVIHLGVAPPMDPYRDHPRYRRLLETLGLDRYLDPEAGGVR
ncbi:MAG: tetratricopeptide repeat protein, partial [Gemmatimonadota bacterium]